MHSGVYRVFLWFLVFSSFAAQGESVHVALKNLKSLHSDNNQTMRSNVHRYMYLQYRRHMSTDLP